MRATDTAAMTNMSEEAPSSNESAILRLKRTRADIAPDVVTIELVPARKRPRSTSTTLRTLSLSKDDSGEFEKDNSTRSDVQALVRPTHWSNTQNVKDLTMQIRFRRVDAFSYAPRPSIGKARIVDVSHALLRTGPVMGLGGLSKDHRLFSQTDREFTCNGVQMVREVVTSEPRMNDDSVVYDLYVKESETCALESAHIEEAPASKQETGSVRKEAYLLATDVPELDFWDHMDDSSDDLQADGGGIDDCDDSERSVDYPSTPDDDAYGREVLDKNDCSSGEDSDINDCSSNKAVWRPSDSRDGHLGDESDREGLSAPDDIPYDADEDDSDFSD